MPGVPTIVSTRDTATRVNAYAFPVSQERIARRSQDHVQIHAT